jgi:uncharacterized protein YjiS (DUF1127 family)
MSTATLANYAAHPWRPLARRLAAHLARRRTARTLAGLDARALRDVGLTPHDVVALRIWDAQDASEHLRLSPSSRAGQW